MSKVSATQLFSPSSIPKEFLITAHPAPIAKFTGPFYKVPWPPQPLYIFFFFLSVHEISAARWFRMTETLSNVFFSTNARPLYGSSSFAPPLYTRSSPPCCCRQPKLSSVYFRTTPSLSLDSRSFVFSLCRSFGSLCFFNATLSGLPVLLRIQGPLLFRLVCLFRYPEWLSFAFGGTS